MPALFDKLGLRFQYPDNWRLEMDDATAGQVAVTVNSPSGGFWSVTMNSPEADPTELTASVLKAMGEEYQGLETEPVTETVAGREMTGYDMNFFYVDLVSTAQVRGFQSPWTTLIIHCQAEDGEFRQLEQIFRAMTTSLIQASGL